MKVKQMVWRLLVVLALAGLLVGCTNPTPTATPTTPPTVAPPTAAPTIDLQPTLNAVKTQSAATVIANLTQNAPSATATTAATATKAAQPATATTAPSNTPLPQATATAKPILTPWTLVPTQAAYSCIVTSVSPTTSVSYPPSSNFDVHWVVKNTGKLQWLPTETIFRYVDGVKMQKKGDYVYLASTVAPGATYDVGIDMLAPTSTGTYHMTWQLTYGNVTICSMAVTVVIQ